MRVQAEQADQQRAEFKHQIVEKTMEVVAAKKEVEKAKKKNEEICDDEEDVDGGRTPRGDERDGE